jgi:hypothetical protein
MNSAWGYDRIRASIEVYGIEGSRSDFGTQPSKEVVSAGRAPGGRNSEDRNAQMTLSVETAEKDSSRGITPGPLLFKSRWKRYWGQPVTPIGYSLGKA